MNTHEPDPPRNDDHDAGPPPRDHVDALLREWHESNAQRARAGRDRLLAALKHETSAAPSPLIEPKPTRSVIRRIVMNRYSPLAAAALLALVLLPLVLPKGTPVASAGEDTLKIVMAPEGGLLEAFDAEGRSLGPCALKHTDVQAEISGRFSRVTLTQQYQNTGKDKIEAVYTFPLSHRAGVDRMTMTIGDRVIVGEVKERQAARRIYEAARDAGRIASLLEQERPNIFTQSVANIEPGATIDITISYVELVKEVDGQYAFEFPTVVGPRYIPGESSIAPALDAHPNPRLTTGLPAHLQRRAGLVLLAPASITIETVGDMSSLGHLTPRQLSDALQRAIPIRQPSLPTASAPATWYTFTLRYPDGSGEPGEIYADHTGQVAGRWFFCPDAVLPHPLPVNNGQPQIAAAHESGAPFSGATDQVPDADRITPTPTRPSTRAGHDISIAVTIDTGGPGITSLESPLHKITRTNLATRDDGSPRRINLALAAESEIPNRDFVLTWRQTDDAITDSVFTNTGPSGSFFCVTLNPPARTPDAAAVPRELIFVLDTSGSMNGLPIEKSKMVVQKAIDAMRPQDTFNIITFAGSTDILWPAPRPNTSQNREQAHRFVSGQSGRGGTEMMKAINAALVQTPVRSGASAALTAAQLADLPADGREITLRIARTQLSCPRGVLGPAGWATGCGVVVRSSLVIPCTDFKLPDGFSSPGADDAETSARSLELSARWITRSGERVLDVQSARLADAPAVRPLRVVMFLTDGFVGNDMAIIDAIRRNRATTRVFSFGIGNSVNRYLLDNMAAAGGGEAEYVLINSAGDQSAATSADAAVERFNKRTATPVLTDIRVAFEGDIRPLDMLPDPAAGLPDLFDVKPVTIVGRYSAPGAGTIVVTGQTAAGPWERRIPVTFPLIDERNTSLPTLWVRTKIESLMNTDLAAIQAQQPSPAIRQQIIILGESFGVMSQFTSFVAVDKLRVTIAGKPRLVNIPIELPDATTWEGFFGPTGEAPRLDEPRPTAAREFRTLPSSVVQSLVAQSQDDRLSADINHYGTVSSVDEVALAHLNMQSRGSGESPALREMGTGGGGSSPTSTAPPPPPASAATPSLPTGFVMNPSESRAPASLQKPADPAPAPGKPVTPPNAKPAPAAAAPPIQTSLKMSAASSRSGLPVDKTADKKKDEGAAKAPDRSGGLTNGEEAQKLRAGRALAASLQDQLPGRSADDFRLTRQDDNARADFTPGFQLRRNRIDFDGATEESQPPTSVPAPFLVLAAAQLAQENHLEDARRVLAGIPYGISGLADELRPVLEAVTADQALPAETAARIADIRTRASAELVQISQQDKIRRTLTPQLLALSLPNAFFPETPGRAPAGSSTLSSPESVLVSILLSSAESATVDHVKLAGANIESVSREAKTVIATIPRARLADVALLDSVRRVEPVD